MKQTNTHKYRTIFLITMIFIVACIETDMYLPAMADMMKHFATTEAMIQSLLSWNFIGICLSGPFYGPLSDSYGRKTLLITAMTIFSIGSIGTVFSDNIYHMLLFRILQGLGCGGCFTIGTAIIFDKFQQQQAIKVINDLNCVIPVIMAAAPMLGGYLNLHYGFRSNFTLIALFSLITLSVCFLQLTESHPKEKRAPFNLTNILKDFGRAMSCFEFWAPTMIVAFIFAGYLGYISYSSLLLVNDMAVSKSVFPYYQASVLLSFVIASLSANRMLARWGVTRLKIYGLSILALGGISFITTSALWPSNYKLFHSTMLLYSFGAGWLIGPFFADSMEALPDIKGISSSLTTSFRLLFTASFIGAISHYYQASPKPLTLGFSMLFIMGSTVLLLTKRKPKRA